MSDDVTRLQAELEAAKKAQADLEAKLAEARAAEPTPAPAPAPEPVAGAPLSAEAVAKVRDGYALEGAALELGALVNGDADASTPIRIPLAMINRHGLVAGATGTGKTKTLQLLAEQLSAAGVPVFAPDIKGDLSGIGAPGAGGDKLLERTQRIGQEWTPQAAPVEFFTLGGKGTGVPIRATVLSFGPLLLSKVLGLNATQESSLGLVFAYADDKGLPLVDLKDLRQLLLYLTGDGKEDLKTLGGISSATAGVILREVTALAEQGADVFFGEPEMESSEFLRVAEDGRGIVSLLSVPEVASQPAVFSTFLMWLLADLFETLPEVGDVDKPKLVFFFDEAHLLFKDASKDFLAALTQTVRLIRSKGVGIFFVTQTPKDVPNDVLAQLGSRVQHQLRAHTPDDAKALRSTVRTYPTSDYDLEEVLTSLGIGEAVVTVMNEKGAPTPVAWTRLRAPQGSMDPAPRELVTSTVAASAIVGTYAEPVDRESAYEILLAKMETTRAEKAAADARKAEEKEARKRTPAPRRPSGGAGGGGGGVVTDFLKSRTGQTVVREVLRGVLGNRRR